MFVNKKIIVIIMTDLHFKIVFFSLKLILYTEHW